jgi:hypothetical protein
LEMSTGSVGNANTHHCQNKEEYESQKNPFSCKPPLIHKKTALFNGKRARLLKEEETERCHGAGLPYLPQSSAYPRTRGAHSALLE